MDILALIALGAAAGAGAGLLAGLIGIGGGIVVVPVVYYGLLSGGVPSDEAVHVAVGTSLAAILPAAIVSFLTHRRAGNTDFAFLKDWGPGIAIGVVAAQVAAPHVRGTFMTAVFALLCLIFAVVGFQLQFNTALIESTTPTRLTQRCSTTWAQPPQKV